MITRKDFETLAEMLGHLSYSLTEKLDKDSFEKFQIESTVRCCAVVHLSKLNPNFNEDKFKDAIAYSEERYAKALED